MTWYVRPEHLVAIARGDSYLFVASGKAPATIEGVDVEAMSAVLARAVRPIERSELLEISSGDAIDALLALGVLVETDAPVARATQAKRCKRLVVGLGGSIAAGAALEPIATLAERFAEHVDIVIGEGARHFVEPSLFGYHGMTVWTEMYEPAHGARVPHEHLASNADLVLVYAASASLLHKLASGACSDLISLVATATRAPVIVAPSMNPQMWRHPAVQRNAAQLRADGVWIIEPGYGEPVANRAHGGAGSGAFDVANAIVAMTAILEQQRA